MRSWALDSKQRAGNPAKSIVRRGTRGKAGGAIRWPRTLTEVLEYDLLSTRVRVSRRSCRYNAGIRWHICWDPQEGHTAAGEFSGS
jgi:hypothetical protein